MKRNITIILIVSFIFLFIATATVSFNLYPSKTTVNSNTISMEMIGNTSYGNVIKEGPFGNISSKVKIAYIVGVHTLEYEAHKELVKDYRLRNRKKIELRKPHTDITKAITLLRPFVRHLNSIDLQRFTRYLENQLSEKKLK